MLNTQFSPWPNFTEEEARAVQDVILSNKVNYWTGNECRSFEKEFAQWAETKFSVALGNGTLALDSAFQALNIQSGDEVIVTSRTYIASISSIVNPLSGHANLVEKIIFSIFLYCLGSVSSSYSTNNSPFERFVAVSTDSANLLPREELRIILSMRIEISCLIFLFNSGTLSIS